MLIISMKDFVFSTSIILVTYRRKRYFVSKKLRTWNAKSRLSAMVYTDHSQPTNTLLVLRDERLRRENFCEESIESIEAVRVERMLSGAEMGGQAFI